MGSDQIGRHETTQKEDAIGALIQSLERKDWSTVVQPAFRDSTSNKLILHDGITKGEADPALPSVVIVDKGGKKTHVLQMKEDGQVQDVLTVTNSVGKLTGKTRTSLTPTQEWFVHDKRLDPIWYPPKSIGGDPVPPYKVTTKNPIGLAFIRLGDTDHPSGSNYGLHGTNAPDKLGRFVSHGCVRHANSDIMKIYPLVQPGTVVYTVDKFNGTAIRYSDFRKKQ